MRPEPPTLLFARHGTPAQALCSSADPQAFPPEEGGKPAGRPGPSPREGGVEGDNDAEADMPLAEAAGAICVQRFDDSHNSAIHTTYRISLRSSSLREPRYPLLRVVFCYVARATASRRTSGFRVGFGLG